MILQNSVLRRKNEDIDSLLKDLSFIHKIGTDVDESIILSVEDIALITFSVYCIVFPDTSAVDVLKNTILELGGS